MAIKTNASVPDSESRVNHQLKKGGPLNYILFFFVLGLTLYGVFLSFDKGRVLTNTTDLEKQTRDLQTQIETIKGNKVEVSQNASDALKKVEMEEVRWSEIIGEVDKLMPQDALGNPKIEVMSYSGSGQGKIALNMVTKPAVLPPFDAVASLLATFNSSVFFKDAYVPGISKANTENGEITLSFVLNTDYNKPETGSDSLPLVTTDASGTAKVPVSTTKIPRNN